MCLNQVQIQTGMFKLPTHFCYFDLADTLPICLLAILLINADARLEGV